MRLSARGDVAELDAAVKDLLLLLSPDQEAALRAVLARHGRHDSLGYFALRRDKSVVWSRTRKAAVAYRVVSGVALASAPDKLGCHRGPRRAPAQSEAGSPARCPLG